MDNPTTAANDRYTQAIFHRGGTFQFSFQFPAYEASSVQLYVNNTLWQFTEDYAVTLEENSGGWVTLLKEPVDGALLTIVGATPYARTETYIPPTVDVQTLNIECTKTIFRLQQLNRDIFGCLKNRREETELANTELPKTFARKGKFATWGTETGQLTYAGDPNEGGDDPTMEFLRKSLNLSDVEDTAAARQNLGIIQGHVINNQIQRPRLHFTGDGVTVYDLPGQEVTTVQIIQRVQNFSDLSGIASIVQGGTGVSNIDDAKKNLGLCPLATSADFRDLKNVPPILSNVVNSGSGVGIIDGVVNRLVSVRSLISDGSVGIAKTASNTEILLSIANIPPEKITGTMPAAKGGTGKDLDAMHAANHGDFLALNGDRNGYVFATPATGGHEIWNDISPLTQRKKLQFTGAQVHDDEENETTVVAINGGKYRKNFTATDWDSSGEIQIPPDVHGLSPTDDLMVSVRDENGNYVAVAINLSSAGVVTLCSSGPFAGFVLIYGSQLFSPVAPQPTPSGGAYEDFPRNTVQGPHSHDVFLAISIGKADESWLDVYYGDAEDDVNEQIAHDQSAGSHGGALYVGIKIPAGKYYRVQSNHDGLFKRIKF